nr:retrovirus-related Pol polyprotein from transposon TNT 1-94 [Tanacetum cinerariifolium]
MKVKESLNVTFNESPPPPKTSPLEDDDLVKEEAIKLDPNPKSMTAIGIKWVFRNKLDENGVVSKNKARLVAQGYNQYEGIDYDETYAPVARLQSIIILLAYAFALDLKLFQMDVKGAFLNSFINEEVYVAQPPRFIDFAKPNHVYRLKKALYGLKQAPKTCSTCQELCDDFAKIMHDEFEMSMMGELNFFLGLQIKQSEDGIFFNQSKYIKEMLKKFGLEDSKPMKIPMSPDTKLMKDEEGESVDNTKYIGMIGARTRFEDEKEGREEDNKDDSTTGYAGTELTVSSVIELAVIEGTELAVFNDAMICNMDSIGKYMLDIILHQQRTLQLLKQKKLMETQEDHSNPIPALNVDSLKVDLVVIQNTCSEKEHSNSETASNKSVKKSSLDYATKDVHDFSKGNCITIVFDLAGDLKNILVCETSLEAPDQRPV